MYTWEDRADYDPLIRWAGEHVDQTAFAEPGGVVGQSNHGLRKQRRRKQVGEYAAGTFWGSRKTYWEGDHVNAPNSRWDNQLQMYTQRPAQIDVTGMFQPLCEPLDDFHDYHARRG